MPARAPQLQPSLASYQRLQRNPGTLRSDRALLEEFEAAPWLLPPRTPLLPYTGVHNLDSLLALRARPAGKHKKAIAFLLFSKRWAVMAQNSIYSLVKHGGVRNYLVVTWTPADLEACADLNLPCADASQLLLEPLSESAGHLGAPASSSSSQLSCSEAQLGSAAGGGLVIVTSACRQPAVPACVLLPQGQAARALTASATSCSCHGSSPHCCYTCCAWGTRSWWQISISHMR
jgi:hypothetical protein